MFIKSLQNRDKPKIKRLLGQYLEDRQQQQEANALWFCSTGFLPDPDYTFEDKTCVIVDHGKAIVGFATMNAAGMIEMFCIHRDYRSRNVAPAMLKFISRVAKKLGLVSLTVQAHENAGAFFETLGFEPMTGPEAAKSYMTKTLSLSEELPAPQN